MSYGRNYAREALLHLCAEKQRFNLVEKRVNSKKPPQYVYEKFGKILFF
jgi:hypothetical protein